jgi:MAGUK p55 subfamily protein 5
MSILLERILKETYFSIFRVRRRSGSSILVLGDDSLKQLSTGNFVNHNAIEMHAMENGQHREMAVDVPESFIAQNKTQPRYPPPRTLNNQTPPATLPPKTMVNDMRPVPPPRDHIRIESDRVAPQLQNNNNNNNNNQPGKIGQILEPTPDQMDSIKKFQEQLRLRREKEERIAATNEFLRNSVRGSQKLQSLQVEPVERPPIGFDNEAYLIEDDAASNKTNFIGEKSLL